MGAIEFEEVDFFRAIAFSGARVLLIGRRALIALGIPVLTHDYDLWVHIDDIASLNEALAKLGLLPNRSQEEARGFGRYVLENAEHVDVLVARAVRTVEGKKVAFEEVWQRRLTVEVAAGAHLAIPTVDDLIETKKFTARARDLEDIRLLQLLKEGGGLEDLLASFTGSDRSRAARGGAQSVSGKGTSRAPPRNTRAETVTESAVDGGSPLKSVISNEAGRSREPRRRRVGAAPRAELDLRGCGPRRASVVDRRRRSTDDELRAAARGGRRVGHQLELRPGRAAGRAGRREIEDVGDGIPQARSCTAGCRSVARGSDAIDAGAPAGVGGGEEPLAAVYFDGGESASASPGRGRSPAPRARARSPRRRRA